MSATIRDNILFSHAYDETFYNLVLDGMCSIYIRLLYVYLIDGQLARSDPIWLSCQQAI
jgi:hypothetical protein